MKKQIIIRCVSDRSIDVNNVIVDNNCAIASSVPAEIVKIFNSKSVNEIAFLWGIQLVFIYLKI